MCDYSCQTTEPICIKIIPANRATYADCYRLLRFEIFTKYDEYFVPESAPLLYRPIFATSSATASLTTLMTSQSDVRVRMRSQRRVGQKSEFSELVFPSSAFTAFQ